MFVIIAILGILAFLTLSTIITVWTNESFVTGTKNPLWFKILATMVLLMFWIIPIIETLA